MTGVIVTFLTWSLCDLYDFSIYFVRLRTQAERWKNSPGRIRSFFGKGLTCRYCYGHWVAAGLLILLTILPTRFADGLTIFEILLLVPLTARLAVVLNDNILRPITGEMEGHNDDS